MRHLVMVLLGFSILPAAALAGPNAGGTLIVHWNSAVPFMTNAYYADGGLTDCDAAVVQMPPATQFSGGLPPESERRTWFVYAVFPPGSSPRLKGVAFGLNYNRFVDPVGVRVLYELAPPGTVEIRTTSPAWPLPNSGTSMVFLNTMTDWVNQVYVFGGFGSEGEFFEVRPHPINPSQFGDDSVPPILDDIAGYGSIGFGIDGMAPCPAAIGACCNTATGECQLLTEADCDALGGPCPHGWSDRERSATRTPVPFRRIRREPAATSRRGSAGSRPPWAAGNSRSNGWVPASRATRTLVRRLPSREPAASRTGSA